ncbi:MAG: polysaccharide pyruvyl transferase family protein [Chloroflexota bacterium]|nr:polysaccharide pyruvyl transferase family protein [Chloroflexota bacterium]
MTKILITNSTTWYEKGDAAIVTGMLHALRHHMPESEITILSFAPEVDQGRYAGYGVRVLRNLASASPWDTRSSLRKAMRLSMKLIRYTLWLIVPVPLTPEEREVMAAYRDADIVVGCGGGYLGGHRTSWLLQAYRLYFGILLGRPVVIYGQSVEPCGNALISIVTRFVLNRVDLITVRERLSLDYLTSLSLRPDVLLTADAAFLVNGITAAQAQRLLAKEGVHCHERPLVGMTVCGWDFPGYRDRERRHSNYLEVMAGTIEYLVSALHASVVLFPHVILSPRYDDRVISNDVASRVGEGAKVTVLSGDYSPEELKGMIGQMDLFIGTRLHSNILALSMGVPSIAISYQRKTDGVMSMMGMEEYVLDIADITLDDMVSAIDRAWRNRHVISASLGKSVEQARKGALYNAELVKDILDKAVERY